MDVALIPFRHEPVTYHADPIKAYEYLAAGVPVVATRLPALERLAHVRSSCRYAAGLRGADRRRLDEGTAERRAERQQEAQRHSWSARFSEIEALMEKTCPACAS